MVRHFVGLQSLFYTIHKAYREIGLIMVIFLVTVVMFSTLVFAFEVESGGGEVWTFYDCIWWSLLTLTTVRLGGSGTRRVSSDSPSQPRQ